MEESNEVSEKEIKKSINPIFIIGAVLTTLVALLVVANISLQKTDVASVAGVKDEANGLSQDLSDNNLPVKVVNIEAGSFYYKPNEIRVKKGEKVKVVIKSVDMMHDFVIDELSVRTKIAQAGEIVGVEIVANEVGEFEFYCSVGNHRDMGMVGTLIIEE